MHIPDGFLNAGTSAGGGIVAAGGVGYGLHRVRAVAEDTAIPLAGLASAYVFAVQMLNFPVANGTSGHLLGGVLAAVLVGPWLGMICVTVVLVVQAFLFADGGLSALGINAINMAILGSLGGYAIFSVVRTIVGRGRRGVLVSTAVAAWAAPVLAAGGFSVEYAIGGNGAVSTAAVTWSMLGVHALIGVGEAIITTLTVGAVLASRPDLVHGARTSPLAIDCPGRRRPTKAFVGATVAVVVLLIAFGPFASSSPDGLQKVAADKGIDARAATTPPKTPFAGYTVSGVHDEVGTSLAGVAGTGATVTLGLGVLALARHRRRSRPL
jgi:cobalt/nickel transport system permease protein